MSGPDYDTKVPENVRALNTEKLSAYKAELTSTMEAIEAFTRLRG